MIHKACNLFDSVPSGSTTSASRCHQLCVNVKKTLRTQLAAEPSLQQWWNQASDEEQHEYGRIQRMKKQPGTSNKRVWSDHQYNQWLERRTGEETRVRIRWQPFDVWSESLLLRGKTEQECQALIEEKCADQSVGAKKVHGVWCVPKFMGVIQEVADSNMTVSSIARTGHATGA